MEAENVFNNTVYPLNKNNSDTGIPVNDKILNLATAGRAVIGMIIVLTNIALLIFYKHRSIKADILVTLLFLANLTGSDILFGAILLIRSVWILATSRYHIEACRLIFGVGGVVSSLMSAWCIFLLSCQVRID